MKVTRYTIKPQTGAERDAIEVFKATVAMEEPWAYNYVTGMADNGERVLLPLRGGSVRDELARKALIAMFARPGE